MFALPSAARTTWRVSSLVTFALLVLGPRLIQAQSALDGFDPNANGAIHVVLVQPDGKILFGGDFTTIAPNGGATTTRNRIARLHPDGTLDLAFNPNANGSVRALALQDDGKILVGGVFNGANSIGGQTRNRIARLESGTGTADSFDPDASSTVLSFAVQPDGRILVGGAFTSIGGQTRNRIARLAPTTGLADSFNPSANGVINVVTLQPDGWILVGGAFNGAASIAGVARNRLARLDPVTGLADSFDPNADNTVRALAVQADGRIVAGGLFANIGGQARSHIARLEARTGLADSFDPDASHDVLALALQTDGKILAGGIYTSISGQTRNRIARLDPVTGLADAFDPNATSQVLAIAVQQDGKILAGGLFTTLSPNGGAGVTRNRIARLERNGAVDQTLVANVIYDFPRLGRRSPCPARRPDSLGGSFDHVGGWLATSRSAEGRWHGGRCVSIRTRTVRVETMALQADGKILVGGHFLQHRRPERAITSPGSIPPPARRMDSTRTLTTGSV